MNSARLLRLGGSFATVLVAYWIYALLVVPWIEPAADPRRSEQLSEAEKESARRMEEAKIEELAPLFPPGAPILDKPRIMEGPQIRVLYSERKQFEKEARYLFTPCVVVYTPEEPADNPAERIRRSVVLEAPQGAELEFDEAFDMLHTKVGLPLSGYLRGPVTIRSEGNEPGPEDNLWVQTADIHLTNDRIWTSEPVQFRWGRSAGRGSNFSANLLYGDGTAGASPRGGRISGIERVELRHLDSLHLELPRRPRPNAPQATAAPTRPFDLGRGDESVVLDIAFSGPLSFDVVKREARLRDRVTIVQQHSNAPRDQLSCDELQIHFAGRRKPAAPESAGALPEASAAGLTDLEPRQITARGNPVVLEAPSRKAQGRCNELNYNLWSGRVELKGTPEAFLQQATREIRAQFLEYRPGPDDDPRQTVLVATGPGVFRAVEQPAGQAERVLLARWGQALQLAPDPEQQPCLRLLGDAQVEASGFGSLRAGEINLWLGMKPGAAGKPVQVWPDRMSASPQVRLNSPQLSGMVDLLQIWFEELDAQQAAQQRQKLAEAGLYPQLQTPLEQAQLARQATQALATPAPAAPFGTPDGPMPNVHFQVSAKSLQAKVLLEGQKSQLAQMIVAGNVRVEQTLTERPEQQPLLITGDQIEVRDANLPYATAAILGQPGHVEGQGMGLTGANILLNRGKNELAVNGPGQMTLPLPRDLSGQPLARPASLALAWEQGLNFNGQTAVFSGQVVGRSAQTQFTTERLEATLDRTLFFGDLRGQPQPNVKMIRCPEKVHVQDDTPDEQQQPTRTQLEIRDLVVDNQSGEIRSEGAGWMSSVRHLKRSMLAPDRPGARPAATPPAEDSALHYLHVSFHGGLGGNLNERRLTFLQQVQTIFGPVASFDAQLRADDPHEPRAGNTRIDADQLSVVQMPLPNDPRKGTLELHARGNTRVQGATLEGQAFTAWADQLNYAQAKKLLTLVWGGPMDYARVFFQQSPGAVPIRHEAQTIVLCTEPWSLKTEGSRNTSAELPAARPTR